MERYHEAEVAYLVSALEDEGASASEYSDLATAERIIKLRRRSRPEWTWQMHRVFKIYSLVHGA